MIWPVFCHVRAQKPRMERTEASEPSVHQFGKVLQHLQAVALALFRVKLGREQVVSPHHRAKRPVVVGLDRHDFGILRHDVVRVDEVEMGPLFDAGQNRRSAEDPSRVPAHVRHFVLRRQVETHDFASQNAQTLVLAVLVADIEQQLQSETDPQKWLARVDGLPNGADQIAIPQLGDRILKGSDPRQHDLAGLGNLDWITSDHGFVPNLFETFLHASQVAHLIVDDGDHKFPFKAGWGARHARSSGTQDRHGLADVGSGKCIG